MSLSPAARPSMIDVEPLLLQASTTTSLAHLFGLGLRSVHLLSREKIDELLNSAVKTIVRKHRPRALAGDPAPAHQIEAESKKEFDELLETYQQTTAAADAVQRSKESVERELGQLASGAGSAAFGAPEPSSKSSRPGPEGAFEDFFQEFDRELIRVFDSRKSLHERSGLSHVLPELDRVEKVVRALLSRLFAAERGRFAVPAEDPREVGILKKRVDKLLAHIDTMEAAVKTLSTAKSFTNQQVQNLLRDLGLVREDKYYEKKKEMLKVVLSENQSIRAKARELASRGITLECPVERAAFTLLRNPIADPVSRSSA